MYPLIPPLKPETPQVMRPRHPWSVFVVINAFAVAGCGGAGYLATDGFIQMKMPKDQVIDWDWLWQNRHELHPQHSAEVEKIRREIYAIWFLFGAVLLGAVGMFLVWKGRRLWAFLTLATAAAGPGVLAPLSLVFTFPLAVAALLSPLFERSYADPRLGWDQTQARLGQSLEEEARSEDDELDISLWKQSHRLDWVDIVMGGVLGFYALAVACSYFFILDRMFGFKPWPS